MTRPIRRGVSDPDLSQFGINALGATAVPSRRLPATGGSASSGLSLGYTYTKHRETVLSLNLAGEECCGRSVTSFTPGIVPH